MRNRRCFASISPVAVASLAMARTLPKCIDDGNALSEVVGFRLTYDERGGVSGSKKT